MTNYICVNDHYNQGNKTGASTPKGGTLCSQILPSPLSPGNRWTVPNFALPRMSYKWCPIECNLQILAFLHSAQQPWDSHPCCCLEQQPAPFRCGRVFHYTCILHTIVIHSSTEAIWVVSMLGQLWIKLLYSCTVFLCEHMFSFLQGKFLGVGLLGHMVYV